MSSLNGSCLVLNASYEYLSIASIRHAVTLMVVEKCVIEEAVEGEFIRSQHLTLPKPSIIRLRDYVKVDRSKLASKGQAINTRTILARDSWECAYCGEIANSIDHIIPVSRGGKHTFRNVIAACRDCNSRKADHLLETLQNPDTCPKTLLGMNWHLRYEPYEPKPGQRIHKADSRIKPSWVQYLE